MGITVISLILDILVSMQMLDVYTKEEGRHGKKKYICDVGYVG